MNLAFWFVGLHYNQVIVTPRPGFRFRFNMTISQQDMIFGAEDNNELKPSEISSFCFSCVHPPKFCAGSFSSEGSSEAIQLPDFSVDLETRQLNLCE